MVFVTPALMCITLDYASGWRLTMQQQRPDLTFVVVRNVLLTLWVVCLCCQFAGWGS